MSKTEVIGASEQLSCQSQRIGSFRYDPAGTSVVHSPNLSRCSGAYVREPSATNSSVHERTPDFEPRVASHHGSRSADWKDSMAGKSAKSQRPENQDVILRIDALGGDFGKSIVGVLDGHGKWGKRAAEMARDILAELLSAPEYLTILGTDPEQAFIDAFAETQRRMCAADCASYNVRYSGTTATLCFFSEDRMVVANVGDSDIVLGSAGTDAVGGREQHIAQQLSFSHRAEDPNERARIEKAGGRVEAQKNRKGESHGPQAAYLDEGYQYSWDHVRINDISDQQANNYCVDSSFSVAVNAGTSYPTLLRYFYAIIPYRVSRSLGDSIAHDELGVSHIPFTRTRQLVTADRVVIIASDGVWDFMSHEETVKSMDDFADPLQATEWLVEMAVSRQVNRQFDNVTAIVIFLEEPDRREARISAQPQYTERRNARLKEIAEFKEALALKNCNNGSSAPSAVKSLSAVSSGAPKVQQAPLGKDSLTATVAPPAHQCCAVL